MIKIILPFVPLSRNKLNSMNYHARGKYKKQVENDVKVCTIAQKAIPDKPIKFCKLRLIYYFKHRKNRDLDNYTSKEIIDGVVKANIILDDRSDYLKFLEVSINIGQPERTEIEIIPLEVDCNE